MPSPDFCSSIQLLKPVASVLALIAAILVALPGFAQVTATQTEPTTRITPAKQSPPPRDVQTAAKFQANWESLEQHNPAPQWFRDAKFGIYFHWGVYSVPAFGNEWYPARMHKLNDPVHQHHLEKYGSPVDFGYEMFVPDFKAEHFDADQWCDLFVEAGAKFIGPVSEHHDGYAMWDSELTPWNSVDTGPKRDITGEMEKAVRKRGLKFVTTFHHAHNNTWLKSANDEKEERRLKKLKGANEYWAGHYAAAKKNYPDALNNKERAFLYGDMPRQQFLDMWEGKLIEVIDKYHPDLIWFDSWLDEIPDAEMTTFLAHYFNDAAEQNREVVVTYKQKDMPQTVGVLDIEKGGLDDITDFAWLTDDTISKGSWCYTENLKIKPTQVVLHSLIDIVSKNGQLILNVSPKADGTIPEDQQQVLREMGAWLKKYGESIYSTRPFTRFGHGPTVPGKGRHGGKATDIAYTPQDIRYTTHGKTLYAIVLGAPEAGSTTDLSATAQIDADGIQSVSLMGSDAEIAFEMTDNGLVITNPDSFPDTMANVFVIQRGE